MTRTGRRLIEDFLLPALNEKKYGDLLKWIDPERKLFSIRWSHKNAARWTLEDTVVFQDWDKLKGHYRPELKGYFMQAKQRFRAALYKLTSVVKVNSEDKHVKKYKLLPSEKKRPDYLARSKVRMQKKEENRKSIPTSVICENTSYTGKPAVVYSAPSSSDSDEKSDGSDKELEKVLFEYTQVQKKQLRTKYCEDMEVENPLKDSSNVSYPSSPPKVPHLPIPTAPVYPSNGMIAIYGPNQKRYESPQILLVKTFNEEPPNSDPESENDALNLCMKSSDSESSSR